MAVNTTVEVVMPPMGDSVSEGSVLEWHKQEGDEVAEGETLVEISTDKVDAGEDPAGALGRELREEWGVEPERLAVEALIATPNDMTMLVGQAWLGAGAELRRDHEHDAHEWWPADPADWPGHAHAELRLLAELVS